MNAILEKLIALLPTVEAGEKAVEGKIIVGATELIDLATAVKSEALVAQTWLDTHEAALNVAADVASITTTKVAVPTPVEEPTTPAPIPANN